ncbi:MAG: UDP-N-acetylmuramoyl-L-alanine--D-glutamate ligase [Candidatus Lloydbacteria bacterium]|nr:UDP-N-acetylmuramoyl-L-alanine--D-glutamate ligase [Candidatus Lloydbacteria bacterium]
MNTRKFLKGEKVLVMGLGRLGGGVATVNWLIKHGADVTITDLRTKDELKDSLKKISKKVPGVFGEHREKDIAESDMVVVNPAVRLNNPFVLYARKRGIPVENELTLFFHFAKNLLIGVTGTRGKTTTVHWASHLLSQALAKDIRPIGNNPKWPFLKVLDGLKKDIPAVLELPSWQLELLPEAKKSPHIALITNLFPDHLNTYASMKAYAEAKANIFKWQTEDDFLILNYENRWTKFFLSCLIGRQAKKPKAHVFYFSSKPLPRNANGVFVEKKKLIFQKDGGRHLLGNVDGFERSFGAHNLENLLASALAARLYCPRFKLSKRMLKTLPPISFRQEAVLQKHRLLVVNDSAATTEEATMALLRRFSHGSKKQRMLITGGTNKNLSYCQLAEEIKRRILPKYLILLAGSATDVLVKELQKRGYWNKHIHIYETLRECVRAASRASISGNKTVLFSPGAASFEKFKNEFDRGKKFNLFVRKYFHR